MAPVVDLIGQYPTLEHVAQSARPYPTELLEGAKTGLLLFAAGFLGHNDGVHFAEAGIVADAVDVDELRLEAMRKLYPPEWRFHLVDAFDFARAHVGRRKWDVVSVDTFTGDVMSRSLDLLRLWTGLANRAVTVTVTAGEPYVLPRGWTSWLYPRSTSVYWLVLERE